MLLERLVRSLSKDELAQLERELVLPARSQMIFQRFRSDAAAPTTSELCAEFGLSKSNLYRLSSEIADECVRILARSGEFPKLEFYQKKFFSSQFTAELARTEIKLLQEAAPESLERFYEFAFTGIMGFSVTDIDLSLLRSYGMKWHRSKRNPPIDDDLHIEMRIRFIQIGTLPSWKKMTVEKMKDISRSLLDEVAPRASITENPLARYFYYQTEWKATNFDRILGEERTSWILKSRDIIAANESWFPPGSVDTTELQLAFERAMYCNEVEEGYERYKRSYRGQIPDTSRNTIFLIRFIRISIMSRHFDTAREILGVLESFPYTKMTIGIYQPYLLMRSALHVLEGEIEQAERLNAISRTLNVDKEFFFGYEVEVRALELACVYKRNDFELADLLIARDLKWLHSRKYSLSQSPWPYLYHTIKACIIYKMTGEKPRPSLKAHFEEVRSICALDMMYLDDDVKEMFS